MRKTNRSRPKPRWSALRVGEIIAAMGLAMVSGLALGLAALILDSRLLWPPPVVLGTVEGTRILMGAVSGGLITVAVFGLWVRTIVVGLMAGNFSPGTLLIFLDDRFQRHLLAFMSAGIVAVMVMLLNLPSNNQAAAPLVGTLLTILIALAGLASVLLAIQHATRSLSLPELVSRLAEDALRVLARHPVAQVELSEVPPPTSASQTVLAPGTGWITEIDIDRIRRSLPFGGVVHLRCRVGDFVTPRRSVALVFLAEKNAKTDFDALTEAISLARTRSPDLDLAFAVSRLIDVGTFALQTRADTSTAHEVLVHLEVVLADIISHGLPRLHDEDKEGRRVYDDAGWDPVDLVQLCVERLREQAARNPETARYLIQMLHRIHEVAKDCKAFSVVTEVELQVEMVLILAGTHGMQARDRQQLKQQARAITDGDTTCHSRLK